MNILSLIISRDGCSGYRIMNPLEAINRNTTDHQAYAIKHEDTGAKMLEAVNGCDVILFRQQHDQFFRYLRNTKDIDQSNKLFVLDLDDDIFNITPYADTYRYGGIENVKHEDMWLWKDGENDFDIARNKKNLSSIVEVATLADLITVTTPYLKKRIIEISGNKNVVVLPNAINFAHWKKWDLKKDDTIRIGWSGGSTHYIDWFTIKNGIQELHKKYGDKIKLVLTGCKWEGTIKNIPHEFYGWIDFEGHPYKQASLNLDIAIIPLMDTLFNKSKSSVKWYEYSALGVPSVVSNVLPYSAEIINNKTALSFNNEKEFVEQVSRLIDDSKLRYTIGENARQWVHKNRDIDLICFDYLTAYQKALDKKLLTKNNTMEEVLEPTEEVTSDVAESTPEVETEAVEEVAE